MKNLLTEIASRVADKIRVGPEEKKLIAEAMIEYAESVVPEPAKPCCGNRSEFNECRKVMLDAIKRDEKESKI